MLNVRVECRTCHRFKREGTKGEVIWKASIESCGACHEASALPALKTYQDQLQSSLAAMQSAAKRAREALSSATVPHAQAAALDSQLADVEHDLAFLHAANGIHNLHYASSLAGGILKRLSDVCRELKIPTPQAVLPQRIGQLK
jgi:hypothetical protein